MRTWRHQSKSPEVSSPDMYVKVWLNLCVNAVLNIEQPYIFSLNPSKVILHLKENIIQNVS